MNHKLRTLLLLVISTINFCGNNILAQHQTEILILGTSHLNQIKGFNKESVIPVIDALEKYNFDVIGIENMPTELLNDIASRNDSVYFDLIETRGSQRFEIASMYQLKLEVSFVASQKKITELLNQDSLTNFDRIELIRYYLATGDITSSALQYSYLDKETQIDPKDIDSSTLTLLQEYLDYDDEISSIALKLAKKQEHQRIEYIDNLQDEPILLAHFPNFIQDYISNQELINGVLDDPIFKTIDSLQNLCVVNNNFMPLYQFLNGDKYQQEDYKAQWEIWLTTTNFKSNSDLSRYALWEMRNLQIASNIMKTAAFYPNRRILIIIGASHKSFIEKYLSQSPNIQLLKFE